MNHQILHFDVVGGGLVMSAFVGVSECLRERETGGERELRLLGMFSWTGQRDRARQNGDESTV